MVSIVIIVSILIVSMLFIIGIIAFIAWDRSFKNKVFIARQTGKEPDSVIWINDRFKVARKEGYFFIKFRHRRTKTKEFENKFYTLFGKKSKKDTLKLTREEWDINDMSRKVQRGLFLYETSEGILQPISIGFEDGKPKFKIIDQDTQRWLANEIKDVNELTRNRTKDIMLLAAAIVCCAVLAIVFIFGFIYMNEQGTKAISANTNACTQYLDKLLNYTQTIQRDTALSRGQDMFVGG